MVEFDVEKLTRVTKEDCERDLSAVLERLEQSGSPILICGEGKPDLLLFKWEDIKGCIPEEERKAIETACRNYKTTMAN